MAQLQVRMTHAELASLDKRARAGGFRDRSSFVRSILGLPTLQLGRPIAEDQKTSRRGLDDSRSRA